MAPSPAPDAPERPLRVVLVDDVADLRLLMSSLFNEYDGIEVVGQAADGAEAITVVRAAQPDLIVLDINMPVLDGVTALPLLRDAAPQARIVMLSAIPRAIEPGAMAAGAAAYVEKSVNTHHLVPDILLGAGLLEVLSSASEGGRRFDHALPAHPSSVSQARQFARRALGPVGGDLLDTVQLLLSELVTNAVVHARSDSNVAIALYRDRVHIEVADRSPAAVAPRQAVNDDESGRGMALIEALALAWGTTPLPDGKVVWLDVAR